ncbi:hypothetical protein BDP81DRAFT_421386 [Colletotrichum phormii]|uniref:Uncharacterized protein n=1 Tax=Colletotrichum phormii TaxID=359342 RepID=A0AAI9ZWP3_9PEZI|nr:uncharacterized protein BDP81DRAFT_421386 [Colletotrichum phormii]KAK1639597.1 hypothetical protein BDP81DRAFT_421386 [Colletotrichum phormii]
MLGHWYLIETPLLRNRPSSATIVLRDRRRSPAYPLRCCVAPLGQARGRAFG